MHRLRRRRQSRAAGQGGNDRSARPGGGRRSQSPAARASSTPIGRSSAARRLQFQIPFDKLPTREELQAALPPAAKPKATGLENGVAGQAARLLAELDRGRPLPTGIDYSVTAWAFGNDLAMVFLPGEVVVDYALRLKRELDGARLWVTAYANDVPCYIVSRRVLAEGGYEPDFSMIYYGRPGRACRQPSKTRSSRRSSRWCRESFAAARQGEDRGRGRLPGGRARPP